jgi:hypothetical protein
VSDDKGKDPKAANVAAPVAAPASAPGGKTDGAKLAGLMAVDAKAAGKRAPDLDREALHAAERALADGERALAAARAQLQPGERATATAAKSAGSGRELALRALLALNVVAMVVVAMLPPSPGLVRTPEPATTAAPQPPAPKSTAELQRFNDPFNQALAAADRGNHAEAIATLERYLADNPRLLPSQRLNVLNMLAHYAGLASDFKKSQEYAQQAAAIGQSHSLPADLVEMAKAAAASGDQETLRRVWARFLLQQRQIPSWLYKHVAEAYLQLGDSYRREADDAAERARVQELEETAARLRAEAIEERNKEKGK